MASNLSPQNRKGWIFQSILLVLPFLLENTVYPLYMKITPDWLGSGLFFLTYCYVSYGLVMIMHRKWRKNQNDPISFRFVFKDYKWLIALIAGIAFRHIGSLILHESQRPMLIWELQGYLKTSPLYLAVIGYAMQLIYYFFEFSLIAFIVDCSQKAVENFGANKKICWGGIFLGLTWGMNHAITKSNFTDGIYSLALSIVIGLVYCRLGKKPIYAFITVAAAYLL